MRTWLPETMTTNSPASPARPASIFLEKSEAIVSRIREQLPEISTASDWFAESILNGRMVHIFGAGHSRIMTGRDVAALWLVSGV